MSHTTAKGRWTSASSENAEPSDETRARKPFQLIIVVATQNPSTAVLSTVQEELASVQVPPYCQAALRVPHTSLPGCTPAKHPTLRLAGAARVPIVIFLTFLPTTISYCLSRPKGLCFDTFPLPPSRVSPFLNPEGVQR